MYLLDTNVVSELRRQGRANPAVLVWARSVPNSSLRLSVITAMELEIGIHLKRRSDPEQADRLSRWADRLLAAHPVLPVDLAVARRAAALHVPNPRPERDTLIAATALVHGLTVVTRNLRDFEHSGAALFNPWDHGSF